MKILYKLFLLGGFFFLFSCGTPKHISYFQDIMRDSLQIQTSQVDAKPLVTFPGDRLSIIINSKDLELSNLFNLPVATTRIGVNNLATSLGQSQAVSTYVVAEDGSIDFPQLGRIKVAGKDRHQIAIAVKERIINAGYIKDPVVTVEILNVFVSVMGEVARPGRYAIDRDRMTVLDALSMAGDLTIYGKREHVLLIRNTTGKQETYQLDLRSGRQMFASPAFYIQQGDIIYVEPNKVRARQSTVNGNNVLSTSFWVSVASLATSVALLVFR